MFKSHMSTRRPAGLLVMTLLLTLMAGLITSGCGPRGERDTGDSDSGDGNPGNTAGAAAIEFLHHPGPVASAGLDLLAFVSTTGTVYTWSGGAARLLYSPPDGWAVVTMALSPSADRPYLALTERLATPGYLVGAGSEKVTIVNVNTATVYQAFPLAAGDATSAGYTSPCEIYALQWSADGAELFVNGAVPLVLAIGENAATVAWDLAVIRPSGTDIREPLLAPDFSRVAYSLFDLAADIEEDLWVLDRPAPGAQASHPRRLTEGNLGGYPVAWLGSRTDGSDPRGEATCVLVQLGAVSTGGGTPTGLAVVNTKTGAIDTWYAMSNLVHRPIFVDLEAGRTLVSLFHSITGLDGRLMWRPLDGASPETVVPDLEDKLIGRLAVGLEDGSTVVLARQFDDESQGPWEYWLVTTGSSARRVGTAPEGADAYLIEGTVGGRAFIITVATDPSGVNRTQLLQVITEAGRVERVELTPGAGG